MIAQITLEDYIMDEMTTGFVPTATPAPNPAVSSEPKKRIVATVFRNNSGVTVTSGIQRFMGELKGFKFVLESIVNNENPAATVKAVTRIEVDIRGLYDRAAQFDLIQKLNNRITGKFSKLANMEVKDGMFMVLYEGVEVITSLKATIKHLKEVSKIIRTLDAITNYINKLINKKNMREQAAAERKAAKAAAKLNAASSVPGATAAPIAGDTPVTTLL